MILVEKTIYIVMQYSALKRRHIKKGYPHCIGNLNLILIFRYKNDY